MGDNERALRHYEKALPLAQQIGDTLRLGYIYDNMGGIYLERGNYEKSLQYRKESLSYLEQLDQAGDISITLNNIAGIYEELYLYDKAFEYYGRSLTIRKELGNVYLLSSAYNNLANLHKTVGDFDQALINYRQSLELGKKAGNPSQTAMTLNNIGTLYNRLGQPKRALAYYRQSLKIKEKNASPASIAVTQKNIANRLWDLGRKKEALKYYRQVLDLRKEAHNQRMVAVSLLDLARVEKDRQRFSQSAKHIRQAQAIADSAKDRSLQQDVCSLHGTLEFSKSNFTKAISEYKKALAFGRGLGKDANIKTLKALAYTFNKLDSDSTLHFGKRAIKLIEEMRSQTGPLSQIKASYFGKHADFYKQLASWLIKYENDVPEAYRMTESAKARALTEELAQAAQRVDESLPEKERIKRARQLAHISSLYTRLNKTSDSAKEEQLKTQIRDKELQYASFENNL